MDSVYYPTVAALAVLALVTRLPELIRRPGDRAQQSLMVMLGAIAFALTLSTPAVYLWFDGVIGVPNLARLLSHIGIMTLGSAGLTLLLHLAVDTGYPRRRRAAAVIYLWYAVAVTTMTTLFIAADISEDTVEYFSRYGDRPLVGAYTAVYMSFIAAGFAGLAWLSGHYRSRTRRPYLRTGLLLITVGSPFAVAYAVEKIVYVGVRQTGHQPWPAAVQEQVSPVLGGPGGILLLVGIVLPSAGPAVQQLHCYLRLRPLWRLMYRVAPEIHLRVVSVHPENLLVRRCTEIRDGMWKLRPYLSREVAMRAGRLGADTGLRGDALDAAVAAAVLVDAARSAAAGRAVRDPYQLAPGGSAELEGEARWLRTVAACLRSAVVRRAIDVPVDTRVAN